MPVLHAEPEIVVVMAGEDKPTYLAAPLWPASIDFSFLGSMSMASTMLILERSLIYIYMLWLDEVFVQFVIMAFVLQHFQFQSAYLFSSFIRFLISSPDSYIFFTKYRKKVLVLGRAIIMLTCDY
jgi:hypothetical protein